MLKFIQTRRVRLKVVTSYTQSTANIYFTEDETGKMVEISEQEYLRKKLKEVLE